MLSRPNERFMNALDSKAGTQMPFDGEASVNDSKNARTWLALVLFSGLLGALTSGTALAQTTDTSSTGDGTATSDGASAAATDGATTDGAATDGAAATAAPVDAATTTAATTTAATTTDASTSTTTDTTTTTTDHDETEAEAEAEQAAHEPLAWRNSYFNYSVNASFCSFARDCQLSYDPVVYSFFSLTPRWYLDPATFFTLYQGAYIEHTDDDGATYNHEFQLFDTRIGFNHRLTAGDNFLFLPGVSLWLPASKSSQAAQRYFRLGVSLSATWNPDVAGFNLSVQFAYLRWFAGSNVALTHSPYPAETAGPQAPAQTTVASTTPGAAICGPSAANCSNQANGTTAEADRISAGLTANWGPVPGFTITLQIFYFWNNGFGLGDASVATAAGSEMLHDTSSHWRAFSSYGLYFQYDFVPWLQGWLGFSNATQLAPVFNPNGSVRSPVAIYDLQGALGVTITLDSFYESLVTAGEDDGLTPEMRQRRRQGLASRGQTGGSL
jgi:hypothetical protein